MSQFQDLQNTHVRELAPLASPQEVRDRVVTAEASYGTTLEGRQTVEKILKGEDSRFLVIVGPCSIHDPAAAIDYAERLNVLRKELADELYIVMRVYFEKPRTTVGWKGLINDPHLDGREDVETGLVKARQLLADITAMGMPAATELLDPVVPQYISDLVTWAAIGARTTESQTHRMMASGLSMPVGFKNGTDGSLQIAIDAMGAAKSPHSFLGIDADGRSAIVRTTGNPLGHIVLRGGNKRTNYDSESIAEATSRLAQSELPDVVMVDCSHANSDKKPPLQEFVLKSVVEQRLEGNTRIMGAMMESNINEGKQSIPANLDELSYGVSVTDPCVNWETTDRVLRAAAAKLASGKQPA